MRRIYVGLIMKYCLVSFASSWITSTFETMKKDMDHRLYNILSHLRNSYRYDRSSVFPLHKQVHWPSVRFLWASSSSSSSCHTISANISEPLLRPLPILHCFRQILKATSHIGTELLYVGSSWSSCLCSSMWRYPQGYITFELLPPSPAVSRVSGSCNFDSFRDGW